MALFEKLYYNKNSNCVESAESWNEKTVENITYLEMGSEVDIIGKGMNVGGRDTIYGQTLAYLGETR